MRIYYASLTRFKLITFNSVLRKFYFKWLGLKMGRRVILGKIICHWPDKVKIGSESEIEDHVVFKIHKPFSVENYIEIGERVFVGYGCIFNCNTKIIIGNDTLIASNTTFVDTGHEITLGMNINKQPCSIKEIVIGEDVWIGTHCVILKGVIIGNGSIVGAGSLVNKSIPENQIWAGTPAKFIRNRN